MRVKQEVTDGINPPSIIAGAANSFAPVQWSFADDLPVCQVAESPSDAVPILIGETSVNFVAWRVYI